MAPLWSNNISSQFPPIGLGAIDSLTIQGSSGQDYNNGEWRNTMGRLYPIKDGRTYRIRLPYAVPYDAALDDGSVVPQGATATKQDCKVTHSRSNSVQMAYQYGMMYGTDPQEWHKFIFHGRIVFFPATINTAELKLMLTAQQGNMLTNDILRGDWASGYFGTVPNTEFFLIGSPITQGFYPDTGPGPQTTLTKNTTYRYWVAAVKDNERPGTPHATLSGSAVEFVDDIDLTAIEIYRKEGWNATIDVYKVE
ncbi:hypothetical protein SPFM12_00139 [Salmonella phage SPFM12]|nr:hypothetical protein SPFM12_00139 [Salmonella phage SPFM12]